MKSISNSTNEAVFYPFASSLSDESLPRLRMVANGQARSIMRDCIVLFERFHNSRAEFLELDSQNGPMDPALALSDPLLILTELNESLLRNRDLLASVARETEKLPEIDAVVRQRIEELKAASANLQGEDLENLWLKGAIELGREIKHSILSDIALTPTKHAKGQFVHAAVLSGQIAVHFWMLQTCDVHPYCSYPALSLLYKELSHTWLKGKGPGDIQLGEKSPLEEPKRRRRFGMDESERRRIWP